MRARGSVLAGIAVVVIAASSVVFWPSIADQVRRRIQDRLGEETGQVWRIEGVGLALKPGPEIVLRNVAFGDDRADSDVPGGRIRELRLQDPVSLLLGSGSTGRVLAEDVSLRVPLAGKPGVGPAPAPRQGKAAAIRVIARGAEAGLAESGRAATASAQNVEIVFDLAAAQERTEIRASLELASSTATVMFELPVAGREPGAFAFSLDPRDPKGHRVTANAKASLDPGVLKLESVSGTIDGAPLAGSLEIGWDRPKPRIALDARLDALTLTDEAEAARLGPGAQGGLVVPVAPETIPDVRWFSGFDATGRVSIAHLTLGPTRFETVAITGTVKDGGVDAALASASGYGGGARGRYVLAPEADGAGRHQLGLSLTRMTVLPLLADVAGARGIDGTGTLRVDLQAKGNAIDEVRRSLGGSADLSVTDGRIDGLDLAGAIGLIPRGQKSGGGLATRLERLAGRFSIADGQAVTNDLELKTALIEATGIGSVDLIGRTLDVRLKPQVVAAGAARQDGARNPLDVPIRIVGPWTNPAVSADLSGLADNPSGAIQSLQDLGNGLFGEDGIDVGGAIGGLLDGLLGKPDGGSPPPRRPQPRDDQQDRPR